MYYMQPEVSACRVKDVNGYEEMAQIEDGEIVTSVALDCRLFTYA